MKINNKTSEFFLQAYLSSEEVKNTTLHDVFKKTLISYIELTTGQKVTMMNVIFSYECLSETAGVLLIDALNEDMSFWEDINALESSKKYIACVLNNLDDKDEIYQKLQDIFVQMCGFEQELRKENGQLTIDSMFNLQVEPQRLNQLSDMSKSVINSSNEKLKTMMRDINNN